MRKSVVSCLWEKYVSVSFTVIGSILCVSALELSYPIFNDMEGLTDFFSNFWLIENIIENELILFSR